jgi:diguanylate cyclase (GGDEF)-like protein
VEHAPPDQVTLGIDPQSARSAEARTAGARARKRQRASEGAVLLGRWLAEWVRSRQRTALGRGVLAFQFVTFALVVTYLASTIFRARNTASPFFDGWIGNLGYSGCALLCAWRVVALPRMRPAWAAIALSLGLFTVGNALWTNVVQFWNPVPYPSISDAFFLAFYPVACAGVWMLVRATTPRLAGTIWLDGLIAALGVAALESTIVIGIISRGSKGAGFASYATNLAYPIGDMVLVMMLIVVFSTRAWRPGPLWWTLGAGYGIFALADTVYVVRVTDGTYVTGTPLDSLWLIGTFLVAVAAWERPGTRHEVAPQQQAVVLPALFMLSSLAVVTVDAVWTRLFPLGVVLAILTLAIAIARLGRAYRQLQNLAATKREARTDELTGLGNRRFFFETLDARVQERGSAELAVLMVDLDRFKEINDSLGHLVGDDVLRRLAPRFSAAVGSAGVLARLGGDEFGVIMSPLASIDDATRLADRIREALSQTLVISGMSMRVDASIGIAVCPEHGTTAELLLQKADVAMYDAKRNQRGWEVYASDRDIHTRQRFELLAQLPRALSRHELILHYQPKLDLTAGTVQAVEALVRWQHPKYGLLGPDRFLGLAEHTGLIDALTMEVLDQALTQQAQWRSNGLDLGVAVNISATNLRDEGLPSKVNEVLLRRGVPPSRLTIEITETSLMADPGLAIKILGKLQQIGARISVDDYGTGYASLAYLRSLPINELKLDRSFLAGIPGDAKALSIVRSTIELAHALGLPIVTEGVETKDALDLITSLGSDAAQGYFISRPAPAAELIHSINGFHGLVDAQHRTPRPRQDAPGPAR